VAKRRTFEAAFLAFFSSFFCCLIMENDRDMSAEKKKQNKGSKIDVDVLHARRDDHP
jgi:hypothetical protein